MSNGKSSKIKKGFSRRTRDNGEKSNRHFHRKGREKQGAERSPQDQKAQYVGLFSGGKDSLVACLVARVKEVVYCKTGVGLNEDYVKETCKKLDWELNIIEPKELEYELFCIQYGFPRPTSHTWIMQRLKLNPVKKWHRQEIKKRNIIFVSGIRIKESHRRAMNFKNDKEIEESNGMKFYKPLLNWSNVAVINYIKKFDLEISPTYKTLGLGGDCLCGAFTKRQHAQLLLEYYPEFAKRIQELEPHCRGKWGQWMSLTACQGQKKLDSLICNECMNPNLNDEGLKIAKAGGNPWDEDNYN